MELIDGGNSENDNQELVDKYISAKRVEGCSEKTLNYYLATIETFSRPYLMPFSSSEGKDIFKDTIIRNQKIKLNKR